MNYFKSVALFLIFFLFTNISFAQEEIVYSGWDKSIPFNWVEGDSKEMDGAMVEFMKDFFKDYNIKIKTKILPWKRVLSGLEKGTIDVVGSLYLTEEREKFAVYSIPYSVQGAVVIAQKANPVIFNSWGDLIGKKGGAVRGISFGNKFDTYSKENLKIERVSTLDQNLNKLGKGRIDYVLSLKFPALIAQIKRGDSSNFMILPKQLLEDKGYLAFSKKSPYKKYLPSINKKLKQMLDDGSLQKLFDKHLHRAASE